MTLKERIKQINNELNKTRTIADAKEGDTIVFVGGLSKQSGKTFPDEGLTSFIVGNRYIADEDYRKSGYEDVFKREDGLHLDGTIRIRKDEEGQSNGWGAALFMLEEEYERKQNETKS